MLSAEQKQQSDLLHLFEVYKQAIDPASAKNRFRGCLFNKINAKGANAQDLQFIQEHVPVFLGSAPVDLEKWIRAVQVNPERREFAPTQVSSVAELKERTLKVLKAVREARDRLKHDKDNLDLVQKSCEEEVCKAIQTAHEKN